jgi:hypothetical protein
VFNVATLFAKGVQLEFNDLQQHIKSSESARKRSTCFSLAQCATLRGHRRCEVHITICVLEACNRVLTKNVKQCLTSG